MTRDTTEDTKSDKIPIRRRLSEVSTTFVIGLSVTGIALIALLPAGAWLIVAVLREPNGVIPFNDTVAIAAIGGLQSIAALALGDRIGQARERNKGTDHDS